MSEPIEKQRQLILQRGERVKRLRHLADLSRTELCERGQLNPSTLKGWEIGRHGGVTERAAKQLVALFAKEGVVCTLDWLLLNEGAGPVVNTDFKKKVSGGEPAQLDCVEYILSELAYFRSLHANTLDFHVDDKSMSPSFLPGDYVAGIKCLGNTISQLHGHQAIVELSTGVLLLRKLSCNKNGSVKLQCLNKRYADIRLESADIQSAAAVVWQRRLHIFS